MKTISVLCAGVAAAALMAPCQAQTNSSSAVSTATTSAPADPIAAQSPVPARPDEALSSTPSVAASPPLADGGGATQDIVVTGSRIVRNGFQAPTPVTTLAQDALQARAPSNIPDALNQLPQFKGSTSNTNSVTWNANSPNQGNYLNLRGLGTTRALILLDGVRVPPTSFAGGVDINTLPQALVQRVDVVTGGASAAYGSDAVVGVVNFILDKNFNGFKGSAQAGISRYGDNPSYKLTLAGGTSFADGRGHVEASFDHYWVNGIHDVADRARGQNRTTVIGGRTATSPGVTYDNATFLKLSTGGTITSGPLAGNLFLPGGGITPVVATGTTNDPASYGIGGNGGYYAGTWLTSRLQTDQGFGRFSYALADKLNFHAQVSVAQATNTLGIRNDERFTGTSTGITIFRDNAFLLPAVVSQLGTTQSFTLGRISLDTPQYIAHTLSRTINANTGLDGKFDLFAKEWRWDVNYVYGNSYLRTSVNEFNNQRFYAAIDAARDASGNVVCRVTITNPGAYPGCVPMNIFGAGSPSQQAIAYVSGISRYTARNKMQIGSVNLTGGLFDLPAGTVSVAFGGELRRQTLVQNSNSDPAAAGSVSYAGIRGVPNGVLISDFTNIGSARGRVNVKEGYGEIDIPLLKDVPFFNQLDINGAARVTDYSTSGTVVTWKAGFNYSPFADLRLRGTLSRDIAAPTLYQLFAGQQLANIIAFDPHTDTQSLWVQQTGGNPALTPEKGKMLVLGGVYSPHFVRGLTVSVDYYHLRIKDAIGTISADQQSRECEASNGTSPLCAYIIRPLPFSDRSAANFPQRFILVAQNQASLLQSGIDVETAYRIPLDTVSEGLGTGIVEFHAYLSIALQNQLKQGATSAVEDRLGYGQFTRFSGSLEANYSRGPFSARIGERFTGKTKRDYIRVYADYNVEPNKWYTDLTLNYKLDKDWLIRGMGKEIFLTVQNLFNTKPPIIPDCCNPGLQFPTDRSRYDVIGTYFTVGARFRF